MAAVRLYLDEDVHTFIAEAVQLRGYEATTTRDQRRLGAEDPDQLEFTHQHGYTLVTYNVQDYPRLHYEWLTAEKHHAGIIVASRENPRRNIRALLNLLALVTAEEMVDQLEYLNFWE
ncbi:MAG TPA: DUF5615 family PIN-like protein [Candidatus Binatia bacterium]|nr:DUF5615 family PIN-like protein [Candidatus Binatia bacterium]